MDVLVSTHTTCNTRHCLTLFPALKPATKDIYDLLATKTLLSVFYVAADIQ